MASYKCRSKVWRVTDVEVSYGKLEMQKYGIAIYRCRSKVWQVIDVEVRYGKYFFWTLLFSMKYIDFC